MVRGGVGEKERCVHTSNASATVDRHVPQLPMPSSIDINPSLKVDVEVPGLKAQSVILAETCVIVKPPSRCSQHAGRCCLTLYLKPKSRLECFYSYGFCNWMISVLYRPLLSVFSNRSMSLHQTTPTTQDKTKRYD